MAEIVESLWLILKDQGLAAINLPNLQQQSNAPMPLLRKQFPKQSHLFLAMLHDLQQRISVNGQTDDLDRLQEAIMQCFDNLLPYRLQLTNWWQILSIENFWELSSGYLRIVQQMLDKLQIKGKIPPLIAGIILYSFHNWLEDSSPGQEETMALLNKSLHKSWDFSNKK